MFSQIESFGCKGKHGDFCVQAEKWLVLGKGQNFTTGNRTLETVDTPWTQFGHRQIKRAYVLT